MNEIALTGKRDFPFTTNVLDFMQTAAKALEKLAALGGENYVLSGCEVTGTAVSAGWMVLAGKVVPFNAGTVADYVSLRKADSTITVDGYTRTETVYYAEFGTTTEPGWQFYWNAIRRDSHPEPAFRVNNVLESIFAGLTEGWEATVLYGCHTLSSSGGSGSGTYNIGSGCVSIGGKLFLVDEHSYTISSLSPYTRWITYEKGGIDKAKIIGTANTVGNYEYFSLHRIK